MLYSLCPCPFLNALGIVTTKKQLCIKIEVGQIKKNYN